MTWKAYHIVFRLCAPMHIGQAKTGNVNRTRPYVTGRVLWGALTQRIARETGGAGSSPNYVCIGDRIHKSMAFTYFYPTTDKNGEIGVWPWDECVDEFRFKFLSTYASTALSYPAQGADEGTLHEVEFISPRTLDEGKQVYLGGYIFAEENAPEWCSALNRLQLGGERGYGWGRVQVAAIGKVDPGKLALFGKYDIEPGTWPPLLTAADEGYTLAHALASHFNKTIEGPVEPLVGRETRDAGRFGQKLSTARICYVPGSEVNKDTKVRIGQFGIWEKA